LDEFSLINKFFARPHDGNGVSLGIGDDTAIIQVPPGEDLLVTTDTLVSGVHFPEATSAAAIAHKALAVNLSDIAAMGGIPHWFTLALTVPAADENWLSDFAAAIHRLADQAAVSLVGGDTTRGDLSITITLLGTVPRDRGVKRRGAEPGDLLMVTGSPGLASLGLDCITGNTVLDSAISAACVDKLEYPEPRIAEGRALREYATSMIDISDGLVQDLSHLLEADKLGAILDKNALLSLVDRQIAEDQRLDATLYGGDDYELLFTVPATHYTKLNSSWKKDFAPVTRIGEITSTDGVLLASGDSDLVPVNQRGYRHFI
jgi:thiamine-monophosphate kinase